jgi:hypothetical protein
VAMEANLIISVKEARKLLGEDAKVMSDDDVEELVLKLQSIAKIYIKEVPKY